MKSISRIKIANEDTEFGRAHFRATIEFAQILLRSLIFVNGGAVVAILTFVGNLAAKTGVQIQITLLAQSIGDFTIGLGFGLAATFLAYLTMVFQEGKLGDAISRRLHASAWFAGMACGAASFGCFAVGARSALLAFV
jgi:hypothetical protein